MMGMRSTWLAAAAAVVALALTAAVTGPAFADLSVKGDASAWREVMAAFGKLNALSGYRMKSSMPGETMVMEVASGGRSMHSTVHTPNGDAEMVRVGDQMRFRTTMPGAPQGWRCQGVPPMPRPGDPTSFQGTVEVARAPDAAIDGEPMHVYVYTLQGTAGGPATNAKTTLYVAVASGLPRRIAVGTPRGEQAIDYYDYGAPIQITLPPCGGS
jgi:hypothetical protein